MIFFEVVYFLLCLTSRFPLYYCCMIDSGYFQYAGGFEPRKAFDITATVPGNEPHDPMFIVEAVKSKTA